MVQTLSPRGRWPIAILLSCAFFGIAAPAASAAAAPRLGDLSAQQPAGTRQMIARLDRLWRESDPLKNFYLNTAAIAPSRELWSQTPGLPQRLQQPAPYRFLLHAGRNDEALAELDAFEKEIAATGMQPPPAIRAHLLQYRALAHLRIGELENCLHNHNADSCLFPIRGGGVHTDKRGSETAAQVLTELLELEPGNLQARWLLNIAHMTLGDYPGSVPRKWRIEPKPFESAFDLKRFPDVAGPLGLAVDDLAGGVVMEDFDRDGLLDLMTSGSGPHSQIRAFRNQGDGSFTDRTRAAGLEGLTGGLNMIHADYDNDGFPDVLVLRTGWLRSEGNHPNSLLRNNGDFTFTDVTEAAGMLSHHPTQTAVWFDYNADGWLDLFIGNETSTDARHPCELYRNNRDGTFTECADESRLALEKYVKGVASADFDRDGRPDLYLSLMGGRNLLLRNEGPAGPDHSPNARWRFSDVATSAGVALPIASFSCWFWDYDNDGWDDLLVFGYFIQNSGDVAADYLGLPHQAERPRLYRNQGDGTFADVTREAGLHTVLHTMGCNFGDLDNDGWLDFYAGTGDPDLATLIPSRMFRNDRGRAFQDVTTAGGFGQLQKGHGIAFGDLDNDGDQEVYSNVGGVVESDHYPNQLFENPGNTNRWLKLQLEGVTSNRSAIGARVKLVLATSGGERVLHRTVGTGGSFGSAPLRVEFGLGDAERIVRAEVLWPATGATQSVSGLELDHAYTLREDESAPRELRVPRITFATGTADGHQHH